MGWLDNAARQSRLNRLRRASYKLPLQVPAAKIVIDDPFELKYEAASCCCKNSVLTKVLTKVLLVDVHLTTWIDPRSRCELVVAWLLGVESSTTSGCAYPLSVGHRWRWRSGLGVKSGGDKPILPYTLARMAFTA